MDSYPLTGAFPRWQKHLVEIHFQYDAFRGVVHVPVSGNVLGADVLLAALDALEDTYSPPDPLSRKHWVVDAAPDDDLDFTPALRLFDTPGHSLLLDLDTDEWRECITGLHIVQVESVPDSI